MSPNPFWTLTGALAAVALATSAHADVTISGNVFEEGTPMTPLAGALVTLQATTTRTVTDATGAYTLTVPDRRGLVIVAAHVGHYNRSMTYDGTSTLDFVLEAVPQDDDPSYTIEPPDTCSVCHPAQREDWDNSPMQRAGLNTWLHDIFNGDGNVLDGQGGFVYTRDSAFAAKNPASECAACHQPEIWIADPFAPMETPSDPGYPSDATSHGISCETCHKIASVNVENINYPGVFPGALTFTRPAPGSSQVQYGLLGDVDYEITGFMRASYQPQLSAEVCGACHQDKNDLALDHSFDGIISEPTYLEWADSPYSDPKSALYATCLDCHMLTNEETEACAVLFPPLTRPVGSLRSHDIRGTTPLYLENAADLTMKATVIGDEVQVTVDVTNAYTGHHLPTGVTVRNMILLVEATDVAGNLVHTGTQVVHDLGGVGNPENGYYAGEPGKFFAKVNHDASGNGPTFFTDATGITFDSRIPALTTDTTHYTFAAPDDGGDVQVTARLIYRRAFRFLTDAKNWTEDGHGNPLADVAAPHYGHLMESEQLVVTACPSGADLDGSGDVGFDDLLAIIANWGPCPGCVEDLDDDGMVGFTDLVIVLAKWGACG